MDEVLELLHRRLGIKPVSEEECTAGQEDWERRTGTERDHSRVFMPGIPLEEGAALCDSYCWPMTKRLAPMIAAELEGADSVLEVGFGTALRLAYYRIRVPKPRYIGIDRDSLAITFARQRLAGLELTDVMLREVSLLDLRPEEERFGRIILAEVSMRDDREDSLVRAHALKLVDSKPGSKLMFTNYATLDERETVRNASFDLMARREGLRCIKSECFDEDVPGHLVVYGRI